MATPHRLFRTDLLDFLVLLLFAFAAGVATASPMHEARQAQLRISVNEMKTSDQCSYTSQCPSCASVGLTNVVQCCWPRGQGYGSPFDAPGFCICAPPERYDYRQCNGGYFAS